MDVASRLRLVGSATSKFAGLAAESYQARIRRTQFAARHHISKRKLSGVSLGYRNLVNCRDH